MRNGVYGRAQWGAVVALVVGITTAGAIGVAQAQDPVESVELAAAGPRFLAAGDRKSTRLNSSHGYISYAVFCLKKKNKRLICSTLIRANGGCGTQRRTTVRD